MTGARTRTSLSDAAERDRGLVLYESMDPIEGFSMEYLRGEIVLRASPNTIHNRIVELVRGALPHPDLALWTTTAVAITGQSDRPEPDLAVTGGEHADDYFTAVPSELVLFALEVVSTTRPARRRDYEDKPEIYAQGGIPAYLLVDPNDGTWRLHTDPRPEKGRYQTLHMGAFGEPVVLPEPLGVTIGTDRFRTYPAG
ncbi:Uma2 family endonuclease [Streptomyces harbinensis]|nr:MULTISPECIES: Uma2 family endonuclease [Streptomyces]QKV70064.1 Uma2 family endonuclease [Streptomyces harbinensis]